MAEYCGDDGDKTYRKPRKGDAERIPRDKTGYHTYEKNETAVEDQVLKPGPVLSRAISGSFKKGKKPKGVPSAGQVADALAKAWNVDR